jgi:hypothetical protein
MFTIDNYSGRALVVRGNTRDYAEQFKELHGKWNRNLQGGPGWIFSNKQKEKLEILQKKSDQRELSEEKNISEQIEQIKKFCALLRANKVKNSKESFLQLSLIVQRLFLQHAWRILSQKENYSDDSYLTSFRLFKLFRSADLRQHPAYTKYAKLSNLELFYKKAYEWQKKTGRSKKYSKEGQRYEQPSENDAVYIYYTSLLEQNPDSRLAITWLTEHGVFEGEKRATLYEKYKKLLSKGKLVK